MNVTFWLLDLSAEAFEGRPEVRLWGLNESGRRILILDRSAEPCFYLLPRPGAGPEALLEEVSAPRRRSPEIAGVELVDRRYLGKPVRAVRVSLLSPEPAAVGRTARRLGRAGGVGLVLEDDLRFSVQYLLDAPLVPSGWHEIEAEPIPAPPEVQVEAAFLARGPARTFDRRTLPPLRALAFTFLAHTPVGSPKPYRDPVVVLAAATSEGQEAVWMAGDEGDRELIEGFQELIRRHDPDLVLGYGTNRRQWPYLLGRARFHGRPFAVDRTGREPHPSLYGHLSITGRANLDLLDLAHELGEVKLKTLDNLAPYLGFEAAAGRIEDFDVPAFWADPAKRPALRDQVVRDAGLILKIGESMMGYSVELSQLVGMPLDQVVAAAAGFRVEHFLIREAHRLGELAPKRIERPPTSYAGGLVLAPRPGLHRDVAVLDFSSMYPNLMVRYNLSPDTFLEPGSEAAADEVFTAPEVGHRFRKDPPGFYKKVLLDLLRAREVIREEMRRLPRESLEWVLLDARQKVVKIITNAAYGYAGWVGARWYLKAVAEAAAAWGRAAITRAQEMAREAGLPVLYCDTDSLFTVCEPEKIEGLTRRVKEELGLEIRPDKVYQRVLFTEAKKRYAGLLPDGRVEIVGLEVARGDWTRAARDVQEAVLGLVLRERPPEEARDHVRRFIEELRAGRVPYRDLIIWKTLTRPLDRYEAHAPHVEAARRLSRAGYALTIGEAVGYVIVKGEGKLFERAMPYHLAGPESLDTGYYVAHQVVPAALRVLEGLGLSEGDLLGGG